MENKKICLSFQMQQLKILRMQVFFIRGIFASDHFDEADVT